MMEYTISENMEIDFGATGAKEIMQNVMMILCTPSFSCPLFRDFAWEPPVDDPMLIQEAKATSRIISALKKYEPRAEVLQVSFVRDDQSGRLIPTVRIRMKEDVT